MKDILRITENIKGFSRKTLSMKSIHDPNFEMKSERLNGGDELRLRVGEDGFEINGKWRDFGGMSARILGDCTRWDITTVEWEVEEGGSVPPHYHDWEEMYVILDGELSFRVGPDHMILKSGGTYTVAPFMLHSGYCPVKSRILTISKPRLT